jgi:cytochrome b involved in lipid metabolism
MFRAIYFVKIYFLFSSCKLFRLRKFISLITKVEKLQNVAGDGEWEQSSDGKIKFKSEQEVMRYHRQDKEKRQVVIFEGNVIDVKHYAPDHPGGEQ